MNAINLSLIPLIWSLIFSPSAAFRHSLSYATRPAIYSQRIMSETTHGLLSQRLNSSLEDKPRTAYCGRKPAKRPAGKPRRGQVDPQRQWRRLHTCASFFAAAPDELAADGEACRNHKHCRYRNYTPVVCAGNPQNEFLGLCTRLHQPQQMALIRQVIPQALGSSGVMCIALRIHFAHRHAAGGRILFFSGPIWKEPRRRKPTRVRPPARSAATR